jgi:hypothetical protein
MQSAKRNMNVFGSSHASGLFVTLGCFGKSSGLLLIYQSLLKSWAAPAQSADCARPFQHDHLFGIVRKNLHGAVEHFKSIGFIRFHESVVSQYGNVL